MMNYYGGYGGYGGDLLPFNVFGPVLMIAFWVAVIYGIVLFARSLSRHSGRDDDRAVEILKERYAKGEISKEEFAAKKKDLA